MNKKVLGIAVALMAVAVLATPMLNTVEAFWFGRRYSVTDMGSYTEYVGTLAGANFVLRIPDEWNGMLVIGCHGYMALNWNPDAQFAVDNLVNTAGVGLPFALLDQGFAYAASSYGEGGFSIKAGMTSTVQLTLFSLNMLRCQFKRCHNIKTYLIGHSMGGLISLLLGAKYPKLCCGLSYPKLCCGLLYPKLYDGVLDISGMKNITMGYKDSVNIIADIESIPPEVWDSFSQKYKNYLLSVLAMLKPMVADMEAECGGTYDEKPEAYERRNAVDHAEICIPVISVNGALDELMSEQQGHSYQVAVAAAGCSEYYRLYTAATGGHGDAPTIDEALSHFDELVNYPAGW